MSDHNLILLVFGTNNDFRADTHSKVSIKIFENVWLHEQACTQIIKATWDETTGDTSNKLMTVMDNIYSWGKANFGNIPREIKDIQTKFRI
jgi:hypothetical protein